MDRFIGFCIGGVIEKIIDLKSNMDRFIGDTISDIITDVAI